MGMKKDVSDILDMNLGPEFISYRPGWNNTKVAYVEGWLSITLANKIFGHNGWSSKIIKSEVDFHTIDNKKHSNGISTHIRITLKDNTKREDIGFGVSENQRSSGEIPIECFILSIE